MPRLAPALALVLAGCGSIDYGAVERGTFSGSLFVMWVGYGSDIAGDGRFVFVPDPGNPLTFVRPASSGDPRPIVPEAIYTDAGSIPKLAQVFRGFSPWGYAPAYIVHDWLFVANHCLTDGQPTEAERRVDGMRFRESAVIIAEAIRTLQETGRVRRDDISAAAIASATAGPVARYLWERRGACAGHRLSEDDRKAADAAFRRNARAAVAGLFRTLGDGTEVPLEPGQIVARLEF